MQEMIKTFLESSQCGVIAIIIHVKGSAYRKEGTWMFIQEDGAQIGMLSGGCLENDLVERAKLIFQTGKTVQVSYDLSSENDFGWGKGAGCNGIVTVLLKDIDTMFREFLTKIYDTLKEGKPVLFTQSLDSFDQYSFTPIEHHKDQWRLMEQSVHHYDHIFGIENNEFYQIIWPKPRLFIIGAGVDTRPLAQLASMVGYEIYLLDNNKSLCQSRFFPKDTTIYCEDIVPFIKAFHFTELDAVIVMTHHFILDQQVVEVLQHKQLLYVGILGPARRTKRLFHGKIPEKVHSPVGLDIHADGPEEIAVSIVGELIAVRRRRQK